MTQDLIVGAAGSLLAALVLWLVSSQIKPRIVGRLYRSTDFSGRWTVFHEEASRGTLDLKQRGSFIWATFRLHAGDRLFEYVGSAYGTKAVLSFHEERTKRSNMGAMLLNMRANHAEMRPATTFWHNDRAEFATNLYRAIPAARPA